MKKITQQSWIYITFGGFILFLLLLYFVINSRNKIEINTQIYFFLIIVIGLIATGFLAGAMKSVANYQSKTRSGTLFLTGPIVIFCIIMYFGYQYRPTDHKNPLSVSFDLSSMNLSETTLNSTRALMNISQTTLNGDINASGVIRFNDIDPHLKGSSFNLSLHIPGYHILGNNVFVLSNSEEHTALNLKIAKDISYTDVAGYLFDSNSGKGVADATLIFEGTGIKIKTDSTGNFEASLPVKSGTELRVIARYKGKQVFSSLQVLIQNKYLSLTVD